MTSITTQLVVGDNVDDILAEARALCEPVLHDSIRSLPEPLCRMAGYHFGWWDRHGIAAHSDAGKVLRPALTLRTATACGADRTQAVCAAVAVELIHNFSLIHDDVIDGDRTRRGRDTVWAVWGTTDAVLLGDTLQALALRVLTTGPHTDFACAAAFRLETATIEMCRGQSEDCAFETRTHVGVEEYIRMVMGKTGALMGAACALGALYAGADEATVAAMDRFGCELGLAFQFADDLIGIWGDPSVTGKPAGRDIMRRKRSLPVVAALASDTDAGHELARMYLGNTPMTAEQVAHATELIEVAGGRAVAQQQADHRADAAVAELAGRPRCGDLMALARRAARRDR